MKIPKNYQIVNFLKMYGFTVVIAIALFFITKGVIISIVRDISIMRIPSCDISQIKTGDNVNYGNKSFKVDTFDYNEYSYLGDNVRINLEESKN